MKTTPFTPHLLVVSLGMAFASVAQAQAVKTLDVIVATEAPESLETTLVSASDIQRHNVRNWSEYAQYLDPSVEYRHHQKELVVRGESGASIQVQEDGIPLPFVQEVMLDRNIKGAYGGHQALDFDNLSQLSVQKGAGSASASGVAATVNVQSLRPSDLLSDNKKVGVRVKGAYAGVDRSWSGNLAGAFRLGNHFSLLASAGYKKGHETKTAGTVGGEGSSRTIADPADTQKQQVLLRINGQFGAAHSLDVGASHLRDKSRADLLSARDEQTASKITNHQLDRNRLWATYQYQQAEAFDGFDSASLQAYYQNMFTTVRNETRYKTSRPFGLDMLVLGQGSLGLNAKLSGTFGNERVSSQWVATGHANFAHHVHTLVGNLTGSRGLVPKTKSNDYVFSFANTFNYSDIIELEVGMRYDAFVRTLTALPEVRVAQRPPAAGGARPGSSAGGSPSGANSGTTAGGPPSSANSGASSGGAAGGPPAGANAGAQPATAQLPAAVSGRAVSPSVQLRVHPMEGLTLSARYAQGYRAPTVSELFYDYQLRVPGRDLNYSFKGNPNLRPERSHSLDVGVQWQSASVQAKLGAFYQVYRDHLTYQRTIDESTKLSLVLPQNVAHAATTGFEGSLRVQINQPVYLRGAFTYARKKTLVDLARPEFMGGNLRKGDDMTDTAPLKLSAGIGYETERFGIDVGVTGATSNEGAVVPKDNFTPPGYAVVDINAYVQPLKGLRIQGQISNLFNQKYWNLGSHNGISKEGADMFSAPGRQFALSVQYRY